MSCSNNFKQVGLAMHDYHDAFKQLPIHGTGTHQTASGTPNNWWANSNITNAWRLSAMVGMLPFMEQQPLWEQISNPAIFDINYPAMGPTPQRRQYEPWATEINTLRCPSDPGVGLPALGRSNYAFCLGDSMWWSVRGYRVPNWETNAPPWYNETGWSTQSRAAERGLWKIHQVAKFRDVLDGTANTIAMGEVATDLGDRDRRTIQTTNGSQNPPADIRDNPKWCAEVQNQLDPERPLFWAPGVGIAGANNGRGYQWAEYRPNFTGMHTVLPPNAEVCGGNNVGQTGMFPPSSRHPGGCHILMTDGAVRFITDSIEAGNSRAGMVWRDGGGDQAAGRKSPYGLWGALGTKASKEVIDGEF